MKYDYEIVKKCEFNQMQMPELVVLIETLSSYSEKARREGLLSLEYNMQDIENNYLKLGLGLIIDGVDPKSVNHILTTNLYFSNIDGFELLKRYIIRDGVLSIQAGDNPNLVSTKLAMYLGDDGFELLGEEKIESKIEIFLLEIKNKKVFSEKTKQFDVLFNSINDQSIQKVLRDVDSESLVFSLAGANGDTIIKIFRNLSLRAQSLLAQDIEVVIDNVRETSIVEAQKKIMEIVQVLRNMGEIVWLWEILINT